MLSRWSVLSGTTERGRGSLLGQFGLVAEPVDLSQMRIDSGERAQRRRRIHVAVGADLGSQRVDVHLRAVDRPVVGAAAALERVPPPRAVDGDLPITRRASPPRLFRSFRASVGSRT